jgi:murein L,D-transpeptidase YcbB/YkuD
MENVKFFLTSLIVLVVLVLGGYWAIATIEPGSLSVERQKQRVLEEENEALRDEVEELKNELRLLANAGGEATETPAPTTTSPTPQPTGTTYKHQTLINELEQLVKDNITMKEKSRGTRVGTIQNFLNLYNGTNNRVDNDYGKSTKTAVAAFQKAVGLPADGEAGPATFQKMIDWLKKQG